MRLGWTAAPGWGSETAPWRCRRPARRCGAPQTARGRAYLGWPPPGPGTWSPRRRLPPGSLEPPAAARCSAAAAGHGAGRPPGAGPRARAVRAAPSRGAGERGPPASPPARPPSTLPPPPPPSLLPPACAPRVRAGACVSVYEAVCMCVCERVCERARDTAGAARPPPSAVATATAWRPPVPAAGREPYCSPRPLPPGAAPRALPPPRAPPARSPRGEGTEPAGGALRACGSHRTGLPSRPVRPGWQRLRTRQGGEAGHLLRGAL